MKSNSHGHSDLKIRTKDYALSIIGSFLHCRNALRLKY